MKTSRNAWATLKISLATVMLLCIGCTEHSETLVLQPQSPAKENSMAPNLSLDRQGSPVLSWLALDGKNAALMFSRLVHGQWSEPNQVAQGTEWFVNRADFPSVLQISDDLWAAHWLVIKSPEVFNYDIAISLSADDGVTWADPITPHTDGTLAEHGFVSFFADQTDLGAVWLDGRNMASGAHHGDHQAATAEHGTSLRSAKIDASGNILTSEIIDPLVCDCCQTDIAQSSAGAVVVYRNRTENEHRDIYYSRRVNGEWQTGKPVATENWFISGCPVNGPAVAASASDVAVAWFTSANGLNKINYARIDNQTDQVAAPVEIDAGEHVSGQVGLVLTEDGGAVVSWLRVSPEGGAELVLRYIDSANSAQTPNQITAIANLRAAGFPQMVNYGDQLLLAWTEQVDKTKQVAVTTVELATLRGAAH